MSSNDEEDRKIMQFPDAAARKAAEEKRMAELRAANDAVPHEPIFNLPPVIKRLSLAILAPFIAMQFLPIEWNNEIVMTGGFVPARYSGDLPFGVGGIIGPVTHMFLHGGWMHILMNLGMLLAFGAGVEKELGGKRLLILFFATGLLGVLAHMIFYPTLLAPMIGASGATSGLFGAVLMLMYDNGAMGSGGYRRLFPFVAIWIGISVFFGFFGAPGADNPIAWTTHIGGFLAGLFLYRPVQRLRL